nr:SocA family protein [Brucella anthropi]
MVYLSDWHQALQSGKQISPISWYFDNFGPFVKDVEQTASFRSDLFSIDIGSNMYGQTKKTFSLKNHSYSPRVTRQEARSIDHIIEVTKKLYWNDFIKLVYSTHPISSSPRYTFLDLVSKAQEYKSLRGLN